jgi:hypothetical protein
MTERAPRIYLATARHERFDQPTHAFTMKVPFVRVDLPRTGNRVIETQWGEVGREDRLLRSVDDVKDKICDAAGLEYPARVELLTPPRRRSFRFGALGVYLGYARDASKPYFYVLEAGRATGEPKELFIGRSLGAGILQRTGYEPTPFAKSSYWYHGVFDMKETRPDEPGYCVIEVKKKKNGPKHIRVDVSWSRVVSDAKRAKLQRHNPLGLILNAASRVEVIDDHREEDLDNLGIFEPFAEVLGKNVGWEKAPGE